MAYIVVATQNEHKVDEYRELLKDQDVELRSLRDYPNFPDVEENVLKQVLATFYWIRGLYNIQKKPSTSEVIDWIRALELGGVPSYKIKETVPFAGVLLKKNEDIDTMRRYLK